MRMKRKLSSGIGMSIVLLAEKIKTCTTDTQQ